MLLLQVQAYAAGPFTWETDVDSTVWRAHGTQLVSAGTAPAEGAARRVGHEPDDHGLCRSQGGFTVKIHWHANTSRSRSRCWS